MHILTARILDVSNSLQNTNVPIHERICFSAPPYYLDWFEVYYPNAYLNQYESSIFLQCMNGIQGGKPAGQKWNQLLDAVVTILKYKKSKIDCDIYIKFFSY